MYACPGLLLAAIVAYATAPVWISFGKKISALDYTRHDNRLTEPIPRTGGLLILGASIITILVLIPFLPDLSAHESLLFTKLKALLAGMAILLVIGLIDDVYGLRARWKLLGQIAGMTIAWWLGLRVEVITNLFDPSQPIVLGVWSLPLFVFWTVLCINGMNIIDGIDCLAGGVSAMGLIFFLINCLLVGMDTLAMGSGVILGALLIFLLFNYRKKIHLGDSGSMLLGFFLAALVPLSSPSSSGLASVLIPVCVLSIPIAEVLITTLRRLLEGKPVGKGDQGHLHYQMIKLGLTPQRTAMIISLISCLGGFLALTMSLSFNPQLAIILACCWVVSVVLVLAMSYLGFLNKNSAKGEPRNTFFLDHERIIQRNINALSKVKSIDDLNAFAKRIADSMGLASISFTIYNARGGKLVDIHVKGNRTADHSRNPGYITFTFKSKESSGCVLEASLYATNNSNDLNQAKFWLKRLWSILPQKASSLAEHNERNPFSLQAQATQGCQHK